LTMEALSDRGRDEDGGFPPMRRKDAARTGHGAFAAALTPLPKILSAENAVYFTFGDGCAVAAPGAESIEDRDNE